MKEEQQLDILEQIFKKVKTKSEAYEVFKVQTGVDIDWYHFQLMIDTEFVAGLNFTFSRRKEWEEYD